MYLFLFVAEKFMQKWRKLKIEVFIFPGVQVFWQPSSHSLFKYGII